MSVTVLDSQSAAIKVVGKDAAGNILPITSGLAFVADQPALVAIDSTPNSLGQYLVTLNPGTEFTTNPLIVNVTVSLPANPAVESYVEEVTFTAGAITSLSVSATAVATPVLTTVAIEPNNAVISDGSPLQLTATPLDQNGNPIAATTTWSVEAGALGSVDAGSGLYTPPPTGTPAGADQITATATANGVTVANTTAVNFS